MDARLWRREYENEKKASRIMLKYQTLKNNNENMTSYGGTSYQSEKSLSKNIYFLEKHVKRWLRNNLKGVVSSDF